MVFEILFGDLAQMVAQLILSQKVVGSNPSVPAIYLISSTGLEHVPSKHRVEGSSPL